MCCGKDAAINLVCRQVWVSKVDYNQLIPMGRGKLSKRSPSNGDLAPELSPYPMRIKLADSVLGGLLLYGGVERHRQRDIYSATISNNRALNRRPFEERRPSCKTHGIETIKPRPLGNTSG